MVIIRSLEVPLEGIRFQDANVEAYLGDEVLGKGTLYVTEQLTMWLKEGSQGQGFTIHYKRLSLHAISHDPAVHIRGCLYLMVNGTLEPDEEDTPVNEDDEETTEIRFVPENTQRLDEIYKAIQDCTLLHPDACSDMSESDDEEEEDEEEEEEENGRVLWGMGGGRVLGQEDQQDQLGALQAHFGDRLTFEPHNGNGIQRADQLREMFGDDDDDEELDE